MTHGLDAGLLAAVSEAVEAQLGLHFPRDRWPDLERGLRGAAEELGFAGVEECARALAFASLNHRQIEALAAHLTIGETYFFRDPAVFTALTTQVFPALVRERAGHTKRMRIWSAGCCTGEEPYSIAIALREAVPDIDDWQLTILATDINPRFLHKAVGGIYGPWSFRGVPEETRSSWFHPRAEGRFEVVPRIREMVTFACLNLVEDVWPSLATGTTAMDLIVCRNVMMYFTPERVRQVAACFHRALVAGGRLIVSPAEASGELYAGFAPAEIPSVALFRKRAPQLLPAPQLPPAPPAPVPRPVVAVRPAPAARALPVAARDHAAEARRLANDGHLTGALAACDRALAAGRLVPAHHYLRGVILQEQGAAAGAVTALRHALSLDPEFALAHFTLGHLLLRQGRPADARRSFANARTLLRAFAPDALPPESEGLTAGRLLAILTSMEEALA